MPDDVDAGSDTDSMDSVGLETSPAVAVPKNTGQKPKDKFGDLYQKVAKIAHDFAQSTNDDALNYAILQLSNYEETINSAIDQYGRTILQLAVETKNIFLLSSCLQLVSTPTPKKNAE